MLLCFLVPSLGLAQSFLQPFDLSYEIFTQSLTTLTQAFEQRFLAALYPANYTAVQEQLDQCESQFASSLESALNALPTDLFSACSEADASVPVTQLIQDSLSIMSLAAYSCDELSVDLGGDINAYIAAAILQGFQFSTPWTGPLARWTGIALQPFEVTYEDLWPIAVPVTSVFEGLGVDEATMSADAESARETYARVNAAIEDLASGELSAGDVEAVLSAPSDRVSADWVVIEEAVRDSATFVSPAVQAVCVLAR